jgi:predicted permease
MPTLLLHDLRYAVRWLRRSPGFAAVAVLSLGIGIGFNTAIFAVVDALLLRPLPVAEPARLVDLYTSGADGDQYNTNSVPDLDDYRAQVAAFEDVVGYSPMFAAVGDGERTRLLLGEVVTGNYFSVLGVPARAGRTLQPADAAPGAPRVAVVSERYWRRELGADPAAVGRVIRIRGQAFTIAGVVGGEFTGMLPMLAPELWVAVRHVDDVEPAGINEVVPSPTGTSRLDRRGQRWLFAKARLKPGATIDEARANVAVVAGVLRATYPQTNKDRRVTLLPASETRVHPAGDGILTWIVGGTMAAVSLVLIIACANVAGMLLARASSRQRELSVRLAIGAGRGRLVQQLLTEGLVLAGLGAAVGLVLASWLTRVLSTFDLPLPIALSLDLRLNGTVLGFTVGAAFVTGILASLAPALRVSRASIVTALRGEAKAERVAGRRWTLRDALVIGQVAVTVVLLVTAALLLRSLAASAAADVGFGTGGLAVVSADPNMNGYTPERSAQFWRDALDRIAALPGVERAATASRVPFSFNFNRQNVAVPGHQTSPSEMGASINAAIVSPGYFETLGVAVLDGRDVAASDTPDRPRVAVINETMAARYWPGRRPIGERVFERTLDSGRPLEIVGVVADHKLQTVGEPAGPAIFFAAAQRPDSYAVVIARTRGDETALLHDLRRTLHALEPNLLLIEQQTMRQQIAATLFPVRVAATLVGVFSGLALLLASIGLYGVIAFSVARRTREIGIRMAIGARPRAVLLLVLRQGLTLAAIGVAAGIGLAALATRAVSGALYGVGAADPIAWGSAAILMLGIATLANLIPARRALRIDPTQALRTE